MPALPLSECWANRLDVTCLSPCTAVRSPCGSSDHRDRMDHTLLCLQRPCHGWMQAYLTMHTPPADTMLGLSASTNPAFEGKGQSGWRGKSVPKRRQQEENGDQEGGCRDGSVVWNTCCSARRPGLNCQHPRGAHNCPKLQSRRV